MVAFVSSKIFFYVIRSVFSAHFWVHCTKVGECQSYAYTCRDPGPKIKLPRPTEENQDNARKPKKKSIRVVDICKALNATEAWSTDEDCEEEHQRSWTMDKLGLWQCHQGAVRGQEVNSIMEVARLCIQNPNSAKNWDAGCISGHRSICLCWRLNCYAFCIWMLEKQKQVSEFCQAETSRKGWRKTEEKV